MDKINEWIETTKNLIPYLEEELEKAKDKEKIEEIKTRIEEVKEDLKKLKKDLGDK